MARAYRPGADTFALSCSYVNGLNAAEEQLDAAIAANDVKKQIELQAALRFNGGGHLNHTLFWEGLKPEKSGGGDISKGGTLGCFGSESMHPLMTRERRRAR